MEFRILGPLEALGRRGPVALPRGRGRSLLALLVLRAGEIVPAERLFDELWGHAPPATANKSLHNLVSDLRRRLDPGVIATVAPGYVLQVDVDQIDASRFRRLLDEASGAPADERATRLRAALALWRGPALADFAYEPFAQADIAALEELRLFAVEERADADLLSGRHAVVAGELEKLVAEHPFRERLRAQLMLALYRCGRQADALAVYQAGRQELVDELGIEPGPALVGLERAILNQDPSLAPTAPATTGVGAVEARAAPWLAAERKTVTVVYVDLAESTATAGDADPERLRRLLARCAEVATTILERHGGTVEGLIGGVLVAVFGAPTAREDDALRAVRAAAEVREAIDALPADAEPGSAVRLVTRIGVNTGEVVVGDAVGGPAAASGDAVRLAARLQQAAGEGEVLVGEATRQLLGEAIRVESVATLVLDRRGRPATVWRLIDLAPGEPAAPDRSLPLVGRTGELTRLHGALQQALREGRAARFAVVGEAGVGKSRLALGFVGTLRTDAQVFSCRCPAYGQGITFWPLRELVLQAAGDHGTEGIAALLPEHDDVASIAAPIAAAVGLTEEAGAATDVFPAARRLLVALARQRPVVFVVDDAHWAQPTFLDLVDYLAESVEAPLYILCLGRPELVEQRPAWVESAAAALFLGPLPPDDSERLVVDRLAGRLVPDDVVAQVVAMAQGNPLFMEQLLAALRDEGKLQFPASVHALLAARLDRLGPAERDLLRCAAVVGAEFSLEALTALVPARVHGFLDRHLDALRRKELIRTARGPSARGGAFAFRHDLIQQAAYRSTTRETRAELHQRLAERADRGGGGELDEVVAYHLEQAHAERRELGLDDEATRALGLRAGERLAQAGLRAYRRFDMTAAENLLARARPLLPADHPQRHEVLRRLAQAYPTLGRLPDAEAVLAELLADPRVHEDARLEQRLRLEQLRVRLIAGPDPVRQATIGAEVAQAVEVLEGLGDDVGMSQACYVRAMMHLRAGEIGELHETGLRALEHARRSGDLRELLGALWWPAWALVAGPTPVPEAVAACEGLLQESDTPHIGVMTDLARLRAMLGDVDAARALAFRARRLVRERIRVRRALTVVAHRTAEVEILAGDFDAAETTLRPAIEVALDVGERDQSAQIAAELSRVLSARGAADEAATFAAVARRQAPAESVAAQALWRAARGRALAAGGDAGEAVRLAGEALALAPADMLNLRAELHLDLAEILRAAGDAGAAGSAVGEAARLFERKGNVTGARRARAHAARAAGTPPLRS